MGQVSSLDIAWLVPLLEAKNWGQVKSTVWWLSESVLWAHPGAPGISGYCSISLVFPRDSSAL